MYLSSRAIYTSLGMAVVICLAYIYLMSAFAEVIAWICVALAEIGFIGVTVGGFMYRGYLKKLATQNVDIWDTKMISDNASNQNIAIAVAIFGAIFALCFAACIFCGFSSLKLAIDVIDASADFLATTKRIIFVPVLYFFITIIVISIWASAFLGVLSMNTI
jgi:hypothetical protein